MNNLSIEEIWQRYDATEQRLTARLSLRMLELAQLKTGMCVLDLATGRGEPAIPAALRVGPSGRVVGVDVSAPMLEMTRRRAEAAGLANMALITCDAQTLDDVPPGEFDVCLARWGLMYMADPVAALCAARRRCRTGAKMVAAMWSEPERVSYLHVPRSILQRHTQVTPILYDQPGTFRYSDPVVIQRDFTAAGWCIESIEEFIVDVMEANAPDELIHWCECFGMNRLMQGLSEEIRVAWRKDLTAEFDKLKDEQGCVRLGGVTRLIVAH